MEFQTKYRNFDEASKNSYTCYTGVIHDYAMKNWQH